MTNYTNCSNHNTMEGKCFFARSITKPKTLQCIHWLYKNLGKKKELCLLDFSDMLLDYRTTLPDNLVDEYWSPLLLGNDWPFVGVCWWERMGRRNSSDMAAWERSGHQGDKVAIRTLLQLQGNNLLDAVLSRLLIFLPLAVASVAFYHLSISATANFTSPFYH